MLLIYDADRDLYVGARLTVITEAYDAMVDELVEGGVPEGEAHAAMAEEARWRPEMKGVEAIGDGPLCLCCRRPLWITLPRFCDVLNAVQTQRPGSPRYGP